jgi:hypothetical protein
VIVAIPCKRPFKAKPGCIYLPAPQFMNLLIINRQPGFPTGDQGTSAPSSRSASPFCLQLLQPCSGMAHMWHDK